MAGAKTQHAKVKIATAKDLKSLQEDLKRRRDRGKVRVRICMTGCRAYGAEEVKVALEKEIGVQGLTDKVELRSTGCHGFCAKAPVITIEPRGIQYGEVSPDDAFDIVSLSLKQNKLIDRLAYKDPTTGEPIYHYNQIPFYQKQVKRILVLTLVTALFFSLAPTLWAQESTKININKATVEELVQLKNIGTKYAERIVQYRQENGPFKVPEDIVNVQGIGPRTFELNKESISVE